MQRVSPLPAKGIATEVCGTDAVPALARFRRWDKEQTCITAMHREVTFRSER